MAVSKTAQAGIREICEASEVPWNDKKIVERIRAFRADARDAELDVSPEDLAGIIIFSFGTVLASVYGQSNVEEVARKIYDVGLPLHTKRHLTGDNKVDWSLVSSAILLLIDDIDASEYEAAEGMPYDKYYFVDPNHLDMWGFPVAEEKIRGVRQRPRFG